MKFWIPCAIDAVIASIAVYFFFIGLADGSVSSFNMGLWLCLLLGLGGLLAGSFWLKGRGRTGAATALLWVLAAPGVLAGCFVLIVLISNPRWN